MLYYIIENDSMRFLGSKIFFLIVILFLSSQGSVMGIEEVDRTKIGIEVEQVYNGYVVYVHVNESGARGIFDKNLAEISIGDFTESITITQINETGVVTYYHSGSSGWEASYNLDILCANAVYTDWDYWQNKIQVYVDDTVSPIQTNLVNTTDYFGYISQSYGSIRWENGPSYPTTHRQECIYNKTSGFKEFSGLYQRTYYDEFMEEISSVQQFILSTVSNQSVNVNLYEKLVSDVIPIDPPVIYGKEYNTTNQVNSEISNMSTNDLTVEFSITDNETESTGLRLNYPLWMSISPFGTYFFARKIRTRNIIK